MAIDHKKLSKLKNGGSQGASPKRDYLTSNHLPQGSKVSLTLVFKLVPWGLLHKRQRNIKETTMFCNATVFLKVLRNLNNL